VSDAETSQRQHDADDWQAGMMYTSIAIWRSLVCKGRLKCVTFVSYGSSTTNSVSFIVRPANQPAHDWVVADRQTYRVGACLVSCIKTMHGNVCPLRCDTINKNDVTALSTEPVLEKGVEVALLTSPSSSWSWPHL
jgi:hypothetical protein